MKSLHPIVVEAWNSREGTIVFTTTHPSGVPNSIYAGSVKLHNDNTILVTDNYFSKTRENILSGSKASILFITTERISYQIKGTISYHQSGELFDDMKQWNPAKHPGHAVAAVSIDEIFSGAEKLR